MIALLIGIPAMAVTDFRVWSNTAPAARQAVEPPAPVAATGLSASLAQRLPEVRIGEQPWFVLAQEQLRASGASYVRLERWNTEQPIFYFRCDVQTRSSEPQSFEAMSGSPRAAVQRVLRQATTWSATASPRWARSGSDLSPRPRLAEPKLLDGISWR